MVGQQIIAMFQESFISAGEPCQDRVRVLKHIDFRSVQGRPIVVRRHLSALAREPHLVRSRVFPARNRSWSQLARQCTKATDVDARRLPIRPTAIRQESDPQDGVIDRVAGKLLRLEWIDSSDSRVEERFQIEQDRVFSGRNQVLGVEIGGLQSVQQRQVGALALVEAPYLFLRPASVRRNKLHPPVIASIKDLQGPERRMIAPSVKPG